ncbi:MULTISPECIES: polyprenyl synthetase family protein [Bacteroides]|uniref:Polyprenyl synthetase family protein n=2 Tax=Bacteroidaceae TaxID=815 RepID=A0ABT7VEV8_9BACE|nr:MULTISPECIES: polyprenyl synthetase family protein [Bacteroides]MBU3856792.1 polyprenyl synthetase family protein [Candidatus Phocaeicola excrementipullorum]MBW9200319.1 polyprenyl synthetase family protein [Bacteroidales bacterium SW299]MCR8917230.1 polyprenyl synthetase family protein [Bacteroides sp. ET225]MDM8208048.1 polyprenyl synthetase family protein [Bacteroides gallinaceum]MDM8324844.1 polyprenyl synthetase family protein [Bacteroides gallinaceum]
MNKIDLIKQPVETELNEFRALFEASLTSSNPRLQDVLSYIKKRKGKMMRPILVMLMAKLFGKLNDATFHAALSLELLHTASLVHDDVVDESDERRGQSSVNAIYNNKVSVLVGDYMLATSLKHASHTGMIRLVELVACLGRDLSEGEILQLTNIENNDFSEQAYFDVIRKKTAALFRASAESGAVSVGAGEENIRKASLFGELIGIAFQIKDDIFDYFDSSQIGKPTGNDMMEGKLTLPAIYVLNKLNDSKLNELALRIRKLEASKEEIGSFVERVKNEGGIGYAEKTMRDFRNKALGLLSDFEGNAICRSLAAYIDYVVERDK